MNSENVVEIVSLHFRMTWCAQKLHYFDHCWQERRCLVSGKSSIINENIKTLNYVHM